MVMRVSHSFHAEAAYAEAMRFAASSPMLKHRGDLRGVYGRRPAHTADPLCSDFQFEFAPKPTPELWFSTDARIFRGTRVVSIIVNTDFGHHLGGVHNR